jgi:hypothetical protein
MRVRLRRGFGHVQIFDDCQFSSQKFMSDPSGKRSSRGRPFPSEPATPMTQPRRGFENDLRTLLAFLAFLSKTVYQIDESIRAPVPESSGGQSVPGGTAKYSPKAAPQTVLPEPIPIGDQVRAYRGFINEIWLCRGVDSFLTYLSELFALIFTTKPDTLKSGEMIRLDSVIEHKSLADFLATLAGKRVHDLSYQGMANLATYASARLGFEIFSDAEELAKAVRIVEMRNLVIHHRGIVTDSYLTRVPNLPIQVGDRIDLRGAPQDVDFLAQSVADIDMRATAQFDLPQRAFNASATVSRPPAPS